MKSKDSQIMRVSSKNLFEPVKLKDLEYKSQQVSGLLDSSSINLRSKTLKAMNQLEKKSS